MRQPARAAAVHARMTAAVGLGVAGTAASAIGTSAGLACAVVCWTAAVSVYLRAAVLAAVGGAVCVAVGVATGSRGYAGARWLAAGGAVLIGAGAFSAIRSRVADRGAGSRLRAGEAGADARLGAGRGFWVRVPAIARPSRNAVRDRRVRQRLGFIGQYVTFPVVHGVLIACGIAAPEVLATVPGSTTVIAISAITPTRVAAFGALVSLALSAALANTSYRVAGEELSVTAFLQLAGVVARLLWNAFRASPTRPAEP